MPQGGPPPADAPAPVAGEADEPTAPVREPGALEPASAAKAEDFLTEMRREVEAKSALLAHVDRLEAEADRVPGLTAEAARVAEESAAWKRAYRAEKRYRTLLERGGGEVALADGVPPLPLVAVPPGTVTVGRTEAERQPYAARALAAGGNGNSMVQDAMPAFRARLAGAFLLGRFEVTRAQYAVLADDLPPPPEGVSEEDAADLPVMGLSWSEAAAFCEEASRRTGLTVRLPTEIEWEYAARGPDPDGAAGPGEPRGDVNLRRNSFAVTSPADENAARRYDDVSWCGAVGLLGGAGEYCSDAWAADAHAARAQAAREAGGALPYDPAAVDPGGEPARSRVRRGGTYLEHPDRMDASRRQKVTDGRSLATEAVGFRVVVLAPAGPAAEDDPDADPPADPPGTPTGAGDPLAGR